MLNEQRRKEKAAEAVPGGWSAGVPVVYFSILLEMLNSKLVLKNFIYFVIDQAKISNKRI